MDDEYISRKAAVDAACSHWCDSSRTVDAIRSLPAADVVAVVRCRECKHLNVINDEKLYARCPKTNTFFFPFQLNTRTHFCSLGERSTDNSTEK